MRKFIRSFKVMIAVCIILFLLCYILPMLIEALWIKPAPEIRNKGYKEPLRVEVNQSQLINYY